MSIQAAPVHAASLYVGDLSSEVTESILHEFFVQAGPVHSVRVCRDSQNRRSLGYAYVNFNRMEDADTALNTLNFRPIRGQQCRLMWSQRDPNLRRTQVGNLFVKGLNPNITSKTLYDTFSSCGNILSCKVSLADGKSLGYGFVHFESAELAKAAIEKFNNKEIEGKQVTVSPFIGKKERNDRTDSTKYTNVYVKNLKATIFDGEVNQPTDPRLEGLFGPFGRITSSKLCKSSITVPDKDNEGQKITLTRVFGFINFDVPEQASRAVAELNGREDPQWVAEKSKLYVARSLPKKLRRQQTVNGQRKFFTGVNLYVKNLPENFPDARLKAMFEKFGRITSVRVMTNPDGTSKGFGFVNFAQNEDATRALSDMSTFVFENGKPLYIAYAQTKEQRKLYLENQYSQMQQARMFPPAMQMNAMYYPRQPYMYPPPMQGQMPPQRMMMPPYQLVPAAPGQRMPMAGRQMAPARGPRGAPKPAVQPQQPPRPQPALPQQQVAVAGNALLQLLDNTPETNRKQVIGERLFPLIKQKQPEYAGKITGMILEMDNSELLHLLENNSALQEKVDEAMQVLQHAQQEGQPEGK